MTSINPKLTAIITTIALARRRSPGSAQRKGATIIRRIKYGLLLAGATICSFGAFASVASAWNDPSGLVFETAPGKCIDDTNWSTMPGTHVQLWACLNHTNQEWAAISRTHCVVTIATCGPVPVLIQNTYNHLCLDVKGNSGGNGTPAIEWPCNWNDPAQVFDAISSSGWLQFVSDHDTCLDDEFAQNYNGASVDFWQCSLVSGLNSAQNIYYQ